MKSNAFKRHIASVVYVTATMCVASAVDAHIVLDQKTAIVGSYHRAAFRVGHGCDGSATNAITVRLPAGVKGAKPAPKAGWTIERKIEKLAAPYESHGKTITEAVTAITWRGGSLADEHFDEFVMQMQLPETTGPIWFKVLQQCEKGQTDWAEIPAKGTATKGIKAPAALLELFAPTDASKTPEAHKQ
jgi:periplasmic copper chaperone A